MPADAPRRLAAALADGIDVVTFASPSAVEGFVASMPPRAVRPRVLAIGPVTEAAARRLGFEVAAVAGASGPAAIVDALAGLTRPR
jgi:uroporphyrinogen-III synthase